MHDRYIVKIHTMYIRRIFEKIKEHLLVMPPVK